MNSQHILEVKDLGVSFKTQNGIVEAVKGSSFSLERASTLGIVGESGSGKSVSALSLMRLVPEPPGNIHKGEIWLQSGGKDRINLLSLPLSEMRGYRGSEISMIFQEPMTSLNPVFSCGSQVVEAIQLHTKASSREAKERTIDLFKKVELPRPEKIFDAYPHEISGGQKQRVMIAMAIACNPAILIADEPTTALDVTVQKSILDLLKQLQDDTGMSIIFITHDLGVVAEIADQVIVMNQGEIVEQGNVLDIFESPQHPYTQGLLACRPVMDRRMYRLPVIADFTREDSGKPVVGEVSSEAFAERQEALRSQSPILEVKELKTWFPLREGFFRKTKSYVKAVDDVSFDVYPGETLGLVGESGCGKTTLGRSILRLIEPTSGEVTFDGRDLMGMDYEGLRGIRRDMQIIFQDPFSSLNPRITVGNAILEPMNVHGIHENTAVRRQKVYDLLEKVDLKPDHYFRYPHEFSGGQRQRICIARALALQPRFIICDESVSALDVSVQAQVLNLLKQLQEEMKLTYIFISHDLSVVKFMSDRMIVMKEGKIEEIGDAEEIYSNPQSAYTQALIHAVPSGNIEAIRERVSRS